MMHAAVGAELAAERDVNRELKACPWEWRTDGALIQLRYHGRTWQVFIPLDRIESRMNTELASVGCPCLDPAVGADEYHAVGFFGRIARFAKRVARGVTRAPGKIVRTVVPHAIRRSAQHLVRKASRAVKQAVRVATDPKVLRIAGFAALVIPGIGPAVSAGLITAAQLRSVAATVYRAGALAHQAMQGGVRSAAAQQAAQRGAAAYELLRSLPA